MNLKFKIKNRAIEFLPYLKKEEWHFNLIKLNYKILKIMLEITLEL
jgi:hypothetical protein